MRAVPWRSAGQRVCLALLFALFAACQAEDEPGAEPNEPTRPTLPPSGLLLSDTTTGPGGETVAWVSIRPGTLAAGATAVVSSPRSRSRLVGFISNGGFDPIAVTAQTGDRVIVEIQDGASVILATFAAVVPSQATPILLRTIPAAGVEDVRPGDTLALVYSEPMDGASVQNAISLALDVVDVPLSAVPGSEGTRYRYAPASPLLEGREYRLQVTAEATDLDDRSPPAATRLSFRTVPDRTPPVLQIVAPVQDADVAREYPCVRATARDASSNLADVQWRFNQGASFPEYMTSMPVNGVNEADVTGCGILGDHAGPNIVTVIARDSAGNTSTATTRLNLVVPDTSTRVIVRSFGMVQYTYPNDASTYTSPYLVLADGAGGSGFDVIGIEFLDAPGLSAPYARYPARQVSIAPGPVVAVLPTVTSSVMGAELAAPVTEGTPVHAVLTWRDGAGLHVTKLAGTITTGAQPPNVTLPDGAKWFSVGTGSR